MLRIDHSNGSTTEKRVEAIGAFNFLNIGHLIAPLEECIEILQNNKALEKLEIYLHFTHLDARGLRVLIDYLDELTINSLLCAKPVNINWSYDWFDDEMKELAAMVKERSQINITLNEIHQLKAV